MCGCPVFLPPLPVPRRAHTLRALRLTHGGRLFTKVLFALRISRWLLLKLLELLLGARGLGDLEDVEADGLAEGPALSHGDDVADLHVPATTPPRCNVSASAAARAAAQPLGATERDLACASVTQGLIFRAVKADVPRAPSPALSSDSRLSSSFLSGVS